MFTKCQSESKNEIKYKRPLVVTSRILILVWSIQLLFIPNCTTGAEMIEDIGKLYQVQ